MKADRICQKSVLALIDMIESAPVTEADAENRFPRTYPYAKRHRWVMAMSNGIARATMTGADLVRFATLSEDAS